MKILNLYSGIGGNRRLWGDKHEITAVENDTQLADIYKDLYPNDKVIIDDAHQYLLDHYNDYDLIWSSPPCQTHSSFRFNICVRFRGTKMKYPDCRLYEEILLLKHMREKPWIIENVKPYYKPLIEGKLIQRHMIWTNVEIEDKHFETENIRTSQIKDLEKIHMLDLSSYKIKNKRQILRNCVKPELGLYLLQQAINI